MDDRILTKEDTPDIPGDWMWESEYIQWKKFCEEQLKNFEDFIFSNSY